MNKEGLKIKKVIVLLVTCFLLVGCSGFDSGDAVKKFEKNINDNTSYTMKGQMEIVSNEDTYHYDVNIDYLEKDFYKASLKNIDNSHEQIILKNENGVFVVTPSLNKSFKFQSEWPYNSSQAYILSSLLHDIKNDSNIVFEEIEEGYTITSTVNYPNNSSLVSQKITFDKEMIPKLVEVFNNDGIVNIKFQISEIEFDNKFDDDYFKVESTMCTDCTEDVNKIDEVIYPMYLPSGTTFKSEETVKTDESERVILTFTGDKSFIMIEEASKTPKDFEITSTAGELVFYENILGSLNDSSLNWSMNGKDYYIIGQNLSNEELLKVASSTSAVSLTK